MTIGDDGIVGNRSYGLAKCGIGALSKHDAIREAPDTGLDNRTDRARSHGMRSAPRLSWDMAHFGSIDGRLHFGLIWQDGIGLPDHLRVFGKIIDEVIERKGRNDALSCLCGSQTAHPQEFAENCGM